MRVPDLEEVQRAVQDHYLVEGLLGHGGMGAVFRGRHSTLDSLVAIKVLPVPASVGADDLARFRREAMIAARLQHPNIVPVFEFEVRDDLAYLIMPLIDGIPLDRRLAEQGPLGLREVRELLDQIGSALAFAHGRGVVHRDVKPANILFEPDTGRWLITDFGIARPVQTDSTVLTVSGMVVGTPAYMAPEQAAGGDVDSRADLYALGAVAYEALTGKRLEPMSDAPKAIDGLRASNPDVTSSKAVALAAPLALDRDQRPQSVAEWMRQLDASDSQRGPRFALTAITVVGIALAGVVLWQRFGREPATAVAGPVIAVPPFAVLSPAVTDALGADVGRQLAEAFAEQLSRLPDQRVVSVASVERAVLEHFGRIPEDADTVATFVGGRFGATRLLAGRVRAAEGSRVEVAVQLRQTSGLLVAADSAAAPGDSLRDLVYQLVVSLFAEGLAREQTGWTPALPHGWRAVRAFLAARPRFRAAAYDEAVELYREVIAADSTFATAHFQLMFAEIMRAQPTRASRNARLALDAAQRYRDRLDPATQELLGAYETLMVAGDLERAHELFKEIVERHPDAVEAWFILGYLEFLFGPLYNVAPQSARQAMLRATTLAPEFAAPYTVLAWVDWFEGLETASDHLRHYLRLDSSSVWAEAVRIADSSRFRGDRAALAITGSLDARPTPTLEILAFASAGLDLRPAERLVADNAIRTLWRRATTAQEWRIAFRLEMGSLVGTARLASADSLLRQARRRNVPVDESDAWTVLLAVTRAAPLPLELDEVERAARRLATTTDDVVAQWLAARWWRDRDAAAAQAARARLRTIADAGGGPAILARSLRGDLDALDQLARGDTTGALASWEAGTRRFQIEEVPFGLVHSLWPLALERARVAAARRDHDDVAIATARFEYAVGYVDQVARLAMLPLRVRALAAAGEALSARELALRAGKAWANANGPGTRLRDAAVALADSL